MNINSCIILIESIGVKLIEQVKEQVHELLSKDDSGHGMDHINRVLNLSLKFAKEENANIEIVSLIALLHDVDDYKLVGLENAINLSNARLIMNNANVTLDVQEKVLESISNMGYSKLLKGNRPNTIEGKIVSDADMCDAIGVNGILRVYTYSIKKGRPFFNRNIAPVDNISAESYVSKTSDSSVHHMFEKLLKLKNLMLTNSGKQEAIARHQIVVDFLYHLFDEENANDWKDYLDKYLMKYDNLIIKE